MLRLAVSLLALWLRAPAAPVAGAGPATNLRRHHSWRHGVRRHRGRRAGAPTSASRATGSNASAICRRRRQKSTTEAAGQAVAPGFINMLSWANGVAARRRPLARRHPAGRDARNLRRRQLDGPAQRGNEEAHRRGDGRHQVRDHVDDAVRISEGTRAPRDLDKRRIVHRRHDDPRARDRAGRQEADAGSSSTKCARWSSRRWKAARSASAARSSTRRRSTRRPKS